MILFRSLQVLIEGTTWRLAAALQADSYRPFFKPFCSKFLSIKFAEACKKYITSTDDRLCNTASGQGNISDQQCTGTLHRGCPDVWITDSITSLIQICRFQFFISFF